ncbi:ABC transporter ATP-binding protein [Ruminococcus sp.]|uniref:ABC transporter ATP-binding protein n=1 Tax=Ruminococcus sp. TaxID=41978 RepID=UPI002585E138|nr:ABC transporter ATP-binding protein [Ruminococcus sp.]MCR5019651.1 ABC transporter ATP-binding protein [Ruminococcus sp.]
MGIISLKNVNKYYKTGDNSFHALKDINLEIEEGEFVVILGKSGSGKSTLLNVIGGLDGYDSGDVIMEGFNYQNADDTLMSDLRCRKIGFVFQAYNLIPVLNVYENITFPVNINGGKIDKEYIANVIKELGLEGKEMSFPNQLSGGQQQRVAIARALANKPKIVLADEPTGNLDTAISSDVIELLTHGVKEYGHTLVMITHDPDIAQYADRVVTIEDGRIV